MDCQIGDIVIYEGDADKFHSNQEGQIINIVRKIGGNRYTIRFKDGAEHNCSAIWFRKIHRKIVRNYSENDPYGEEINEMRKSRFTPPDFVVKEISPVDVLDDIARQLIGERKFGHGILEETLANYLRKKLIGKVCSFPVEGKDIDGNPEIHGAGHWWIDNIYKDYDKKIHFVGHGFFSGKEDTNDVILHVAKGETNKIYYEEKQIFNPNDPYGEEEWESESVMNEEVSGYPVESIAIKDIYLAYPYASIEEICDILTKLFVGKTVDVNYFNQSGADTEGGGWLRNRHISRIKIDKNSDELDQIYAESSNGGTADVDINDVFYFKEGDVDMDLLHPLERRKPRMRWYRKGKLVQEDVDNLREEIKKHAIRFDNSGEMMEIVHRLLSLKFVIFNVEGILEFKNTENYNYFIPYNDKDYDYSRGRRHTIEEVHYPALSHREFMELLTPPEKPGRIRWYRHGKLEEEYRDIKDLNKLKVGDTVIYNFHTFDTCGDMEELNGKKGKVVDIMNTGGIGVEFEEKIPHGHNCNDTGKKGYCRYFDPADLEKYEDNKMVRLRWYKNGKLNENIDPEEVRIGQRVVYRYDEHYRLRAFTGSKKILDGLLGNIIESHTANSVGVEFDQNIKELYNIGHSCKGLGKPGHCYWVDLNLLEPTEEGKPREPRIRWYRKGKLEETMTTSFLSFRNQ